MDTFWSSAAIIGLMALYLGMGVWIFSGLLLISFTALGLILDFPLDRIGAIAKGIIWRSASAWELAAIPMFILMGEIIFRTNISERLFRGLVPLVSRIPGGLLHTNVFGCTLFAAVSGSSTATTATVGKITVTELSERKYDPALAVGSLAGAGSLGLLIPPSILMIIYGVLAEVSITKLFAAGVMPGILVSGLYTAYIAFRCIANPALSPKSIEIYTWTARARSLLDLGPILILMGIVLGGIYSGLATPSEAAALGVAAAVLIAIATKQLTVATFIEALVSAVSASSMICSILVMAALLSSTMGYLHVPANLAAAIGQLELSPFGLIVILGVFYVILGLFLDGISITVMSLPITLPLIVHAGFDPLWFGVFLVIMVEMGLMTPPVGFNLFVLQGLTGQPLAFVARAALPFFCLMIIATIILTAYPEIALWLPRLLMGA